MRRTILIADDSSTIRRIVEHCFASSDVRVVPAVDGASALEAVREESFDLAFVDVLMPGMTGYEVAETLAKDAATGGLPVILLSGAFEPFDEERAESCGAIGHLSKPFDEAELLAVAEKVFGQHPPARKIDVVRSVEGSTSPVKIRTDAPDDSSDPEKGVDDPDGPFDPFGESDPAELPSAEGQEEVLGLAVTAPQPVTSSISAEEERALSGECEDSDSQEEWVDPAPLPGDEDFDLGPVAGSFAGVKAGEQILREEIQRTLERIAPDIVREIAWEILPDLLERLLREATARPGDDAGESKR